MVGVCFEYSNSDEFNKKDKKDWIPLKFKVSGLSVTKTGQKPPRALSKGITNMKKIKQKVIQI